MRCYGGGHPVPSCIIPSSFSVTGLMSNTVCLSVSVSLCLSLSLCLVLYRSPLLCSLRPLAPSAARNANDAQIRIISSGRFNRSGAMSVARTRRSTALSRVPGDGPPGTPRSPMPGSPAAARWTSRRAGKTTGAAAPNTHGVSGVFSETPFTDGLAHTVRIEYALDYAGAGRREAVLRVYLDDAERYGRERTTVWELYGNNMYHWLTGTV